MKNSKRTKILISILILTFILIILLKYFNYVTFKEGFNTTKDPDCKTCNEQNILSSQNNSACTECEFDPPPTTQFGVGVGATVTVGGVGGVGVEFDSTATTDNFKGDQLYNLKKSGKCFGIKKDGTTPGYTSCAKGNGWPKFYIEKLGTSQAEAGDGAFQLRIQHSNKGNNFCILQDDTGKISYAKCNADKYKNWKIFKSKDLNTPNRYKIAANTKIGSSTNNSAGKCLYFNAKDTNADKDLGLFTCNMSGIAIDITKI